MENNNGLNKLLSKSISSKRLRRKQERDSDVPDQDEDGLRGRSLGSRDTLDSDATHSLSTNLADDGESKSLASYESDRDSSRSLPALSTHPSQIGYLTTSSPVVQATHLVESLSPVTDGDSNSTTSKSSTFPSKRSKSVDPKDRKVSRSKTGLLPPHKPTRRSPSPGGKFKGIFKGKKSSSNSSPERQTPTDPLPPLPPSQQPTIPSADVDPVPVPPIIEPPAAAKVALLDKRSRVQPKVDTGAPPRTPPTGEKPAPLIVNTPPTPTEPIQRSSAQSSPELRSSFWNGSGSGTTSNGSPPTQTLSAHRRSQSGSGSIVPSKLSNIVTASLTPTVESGEVAPNVPTPNQNQASGFFSSVLSVAQNAASTLSNIQTNGIGLGGNKTKTTAPKAQDIPETEEKIEAPRPESQSQSRSRSQLHMDDTKEQRQSAVSTLGAGELSLSQLGLADLPSALTTPMGSKFPDVADTRARSESAPVDSPVTPPDIGLDEASSRPRSLYEAASGDQTPPPGDANGVQRTSSLRSAMKQPHRKRGSSVTTGNTIGAAIVAANTSLAHPNLSAPKLTGFAIASKKRNRDFHELFKSVPDDDYLIEDYSCALQREILAHGRLYVSEGHLCFSSNIFGWTTTLVMSFDEIVSVEKRSTALVFKNGLMITTLHAKHIFASFTSRDATYDLIVNIWKLGHPTLKSTLNGVRLEGTGGDKTEKVDAEPSALDDEQDRDGSVTDDGSDDDDEDDEEYYDEDVHEEMHNASLAEANGGEGETEKATSRKVSGVATANGGPPEDAPTTSGSAGDFPGPATHAPTDCGDSAAHYDKVVGDDVVPAPLGKVYNLVFGGGSANWMSQWLTGDQKCFDMQMDDKKGLSLEDKSRSYSYTKPLYGSIGPRQTKCIVTETIENLDYEKAVNVIVSTQTPDVPNGNVFCVKTKYCLSWAENNATRMQVNCTVEWSGKSWIKGPIEKGANDGQTTYCKDLFSALRGAVSSKGLGPTPLPSALKKGKKGKKARAAQVPTGNVENNTPKRPDKQSWGVLEPIRGLLEPLADIIQPLLTGNVMYGLLVGLLVATWFGFGFTPSRAPQGVGMYRPERIAAYEEIWRREDSELWEWLEERVGMDRMNSDRMSVRKRAIEPRTVEEHLREVRMDEKEVEEAIRVTEEKLRVLKEVMGKKATGAANDKSPEQGSS